MSGSAPAMRNRSSQLVNQYTHPPVSHYYRADNEAGSVGRKKCNNFSDFFRLRCPPYRRFLAVLGEKLPTIFSEMIEQICHDVTNTNRVYANSVLDNFHCLRPR